MGDKDILACVHHKLLRIEIRASCFSESLGAEYTVLGTSHPGTGTEVYQDGDYRSELFDFKRRKDN